MQSLLDWIQSQESWALLTLQKWCEIHSGTDAFDGLEQLFQELKNSFSILGGLQEEIAIPPRKILSISSRTEKKTRILFAGHMDIAHPAHIPLEPCHLGDRKTLVGRGTADMKSGLLIMLLALQAFEKTRWADRIGWDILITPDEEIGSPGSASILQEKARQCAIGCVFEPSFPDGCFVGERKGSANFTLTAKGRAAHAGRDFEKGRNAILILARLALKISALTDLQEGITVNVGMMRGGETYNSVPDHTVCGVNVRVREPAQLERIERQIEIWIADENREGDACVLLHRDSWRAPKVLDEKTEKLFYLLKQCGSEMGVAVSWRASGGVCDGNTLAEAGLPVIDTLGGIGGNLHTAGEYVHLDSLVSRAQLTLRFLIAYVQLLGEKA